MTKAEKKQVSEIWAEVENIVTIADPNFTTKLYCVAGKFNKESLDHIKELLDLLRIQIKYMQLNAEALEREKGILVKMIDNSGHH